jgi:hypothetical protein
MGHDHGHGWTWTHDAAAAAAEQGNNLPPKFQSQLDLRPKAQRSAMQMDALVLVDSKANEREIEGGLGDVDTLIIHFRQRQRDPW